MAARAHKDWNGSTDGTPWMQRTLIGLFRFTPLAVVYGIVALVIPFYMLLDRKGYRASRDFYRKRMGHGPLKSVLSVWRNEYNLGKVVMDRFAMYAGKKFRFEAEGMDQFRELLSRESGIIMLASHVGNFELAGYSIPTREKRINALVFPGETATVMQGREALFSETNIRMVPVSEDLSHLVILNNALSDGEIVSIHADRLFGSSKRIRVPFFGEEASLPAGPFVLASAKDVPVVCTFVMKESVHRYRIFLQPIEGARQDLARAFAGRMEDILHRYPYQWYNFYDFWA